MENNKMDDIFKASLNNREIKPSSNSWDRLESMLGEEMPITEPMTKSKNWLPYILGLGLIILTTIFFVFNNNELQEISPTNKESVEYAIKETKDNTQSTSTIKKETEKSLTVEKSLYTDVAKTDDIPKIDAQSIEDIKKSMVVVNKNKTSVASNILTKEAEEIDETYSDQEEPIVESIVDEKVDAKIIPPTNSNTNVPDEESKITSLINEIASTPINEISEQEKMEIEDVRSNNNLEDEVSRLLTSSLKDVKSTTPEKSNIIDPSKLLDEAEAEASRTYVQRMVKKVNKKTNSAFAFLAKRNLKKQEQ